RTHVGLTPAPRFDIDFVLVLVVGRFPIDSVDFQEIVDCCHRKCSLKSREVCVSRGTFLFFASQPSLLTRLSSGWPASCEEFKKSDPTAVAPIVGVVRPMGRARDVAFGPPPASL